jgi:pyridoxal phosphate enzyme (YggS family)
VQIRSVVFDAEGQQLGNVHKVLFSFVTLGPIMTMIQINLQTVHARVTAACRSACRDSGEVTVLAVSKTFGPDMVAQAHAAGQTAFGENYIQEAVQKITQLRHLPLQWHCIGPIQSNKTRLVAEHFDWVHTVDRLKTAQRLSEQRPPHLPVLQVCIQVNVDGGTSKSGVLPEDALTLALQMAALPNLRLRGVMSIPEPAPDFTAACAVFARVKAVFDVLNAQGLALDTLSMGMSADLEAAIHSGSTMVRVGAAIFGGRATL